MPRKSVFYRDLNIESLAERVARNIRMAIISGKLKPGEKIIENELSNSMKISRSPVREALRTLEQEGLVTLIPRKGAKVTEISLREVKEIYAIRANLESLAAKLAVPNLKPVQLKKIEDLLRMMSVKTKKNDVDSIVKLNEEFHDIILQASDNQKLYQLIQSLKNQIQRFRTASLSIPGRLKIVLSDHQKIVKACRQRKASLVERLIREHIIQAGKKLLEILERRK